MTSTDRHTCDTTSILEGWSRRTFLGAMGAVAAGTVAACTNSGEDTPDAVLGKVGDRRVREPSTKGAGDAYTPTPPFTLNAVSELSEDYFLVQNHRIDPAKDKVVAYSRADGEVETVILQDGVVKQVFRDPTQAGGWNVRSAARRRWSRRHGGRSVRADVRRRQADIEGVLPQRGGQIPSVCGRATPWPVPGPLGSRRRASRGPAEPGNCRSR